MKNKEINIVLLHYFGGAAESWKWMIEKLSGSFNCIALNLPGFGNTDALPVRKIENFAQFVLDEIDKKKAGNCILVGHSMGGKIALKAAAMDTGNRVSKLILIAPSPPGTEPMPDDEKKRMLNHTREEAENTVRKVTRIKLDKEKFDVAVNTQLQIEEKTWKWWIEEGMNSPITDDIPKVRVPIVVVASDDDPVMTKEVIHDRVMAALPHAEMRKIKNAGHLIPMEDPDGTAEIIRTL